MSPECRQQVEKSETLPRSLKEAEAESVAFPCLESVSIDGADAKGRQIAVNPVRASRKDSLSLKTLSRLGEGF